MVWGNTRVTALHRAAMRLLGEPIFHFFLLGGAVFIVFGSIDRPVADEPGRIVITQAQVENLAAAFTRIHRRAPTADETDGLIRDYLHEEVYYREAVSLGLDRDDIVIRQRLRQKMEFIADDVGALAEPTEEELRAFLDAHADEFRIEPTISFRHFYLDPDRRRGTLARDGAALLARLANADATADGDGFGDPFVLDTRFDDRPLAEIGALFGEQFAAAVARLPTNQWHGPIASAYGSHLVFISTRTEGSVPVLEDVHDAVRREWVHRQRRQASEKLFDSLLQRYAVTIDRP